jgi:peptidoglycan/LPS O-acetylase OafA/YrhL
MGSDNKPRENSFDAIRLIAALFVFHSHQFVLSGRPEDHVPWLNTSLSGIGVATFFAISGYLVTKSAVRNPNLLSFYWNRVVRIMPGLTANVLFLLAIGAAVTTLPLSEFLRSPVTLEFLHNNLLLAFNDPRYVLPGAFEGNVERGLNGSLWTLPYEIALYIVMGLVLCAARSKPARLTVAMIGFVVCFTILVVKTQVPSFSYVLDVWNVLLVEMFGISGMMFMLGILIALADDLRHSFMISAAAAFVLYWGIPQLAGAYIFLAATVILIGESPYLKLPKFLGDCSYGLYLYGFPVQQLLVHLWGREHFWARYAVGLMICFALAILSWKLLERPALHYLKWKPKPRVSREPLPGQPAHPA